MRILVIEDELELLYSISEGLELSGYAVDLAADGEMGEEKATTQDYDLIILDINLPKLNGFEVLKKVRNINKEVNIIILSAKAEIDDKIMGLDLGANDYLTKPFHFMELDARIRSLLRRKTVQIDTFIKVKSLEFNTASKIVKINGNVLSLTSKEISLLEYLLLNMDILVSSQELIEHVWNESVDEFSNSIRVHISSLRRKIKKEMGVDLIENIIGKGYIIKGDEQ